MTDPVADEALLAEAEIFAKRLNGLVSGVLGSSFPLFRAEVIKGKDHVRVAAPPLPILRKDTGDCFAVLAAHFNCDWSSVKGILAVRGSSFTLRTPSVAGPPVLQVDYLRDMESSDRPVSHINVSSQHKGLLGMVNPESYRLDERLAAF